MTLDERIAEVQEVARLQDVWMNVRGRGLRTVARCEMDEAAANLDFIALATDLTAVKERIAELEGEIQRTEHALTDLRGALVEREGECERLREERDALEIALRAMCLWPMSRLGTCQWTDPAHEKEAWEAVTLSNDTLAAIDRARKEKDRE